MKGQSEILVFVLLTLLSISLLMITVVWGRDAIEKNVGITRVTVAERELKEIDEVIKSIIKFDGLERIEYNSEGPILLVGDNALEIRTEVNPDIAIPDYWVNITEDGSFITEVLEGSVFRAQLVYPEGEQKIVLFTDGPTMSKPELIVVEKNETFLENNKITIKIRITFI